MPRRKSTQRKYKKRITSGITNNEPNTPNPTNPYQIESEYTTTSSNSTYTKQEKNKRKRLKYKQKRKENRKTKKTNSNNLPTPGNTKEWLQEVKNNKSLTKKQKSNLISIHNTYKIIERNNSTLHQLKTSLNKNTFKDTNLTYFTTTCSNQKSEPSIISTTITSLEEENKTLITTITNLKKSVTLLTNKRITTIKKAGQQQRRYIRPCIHQLQHKQLLFSTLAKYRSTISNINLSNLLLHQETSKRKTSIIKETLKLKNTNKIHNFTYKTLPKDTIDLLNKGTNFIPTPTNIVEESSIHSYSFGTTASEMSTTLLSPIFLSNSSSLLFTYQLKLFSSLLIQFSQLIRPLPPSLWVHIF